MRKPFSILVVDDNRSMVQIIGDILTLKGMQPITVSTGFEALEIIKKQKVNILLTDVRMPEMNGVELYREACKFQPRLVTYLMTGYMEDGIIQQGIQEGVKKVLTKPLDINYMIRLFEKEKNGREK